MKLAYLFFCVLIAFVVWSLSYGVILSVAFQDERVLKATLTLRPFLPLQQFWIYRSNHTLQIVAVWATLSAILISGIVALMILRPNKNPLGDASFQTITDLRSGGWLRKKGHIFGRIGTSLIRKIDDRHHLIIGPTRSGKGVGYVIPNALTHQGSMIVTDLKGEIWRLTAGYRKAHGSQVFLFSPGNAATHRYNPLDFIRSDRGTRTTDIQNIASILVPENPDSENAVWQATAQQVLAGAISYILESSHYKDRRNLGEVNSFFNSGFNLQVLMKLIKETEVHLSKFTIESFNSYLALSERAAASALLDVQKALNPWKNERIIAATSVTEMDLAALKRRPVSIYLAPSITDVTLLKPLLTLFVQQTMDILTRNMQETKIPVFFLLDEFRQLGRMTEIMAKLPYVAGYGIKLAFIIQDLKNLDEIYGETSRHSLLGNCGYQLAFGANDQATSDYISKALGKTTIRYQSESKTMERMGLNRRTYTEQIRERDLMMPQEIRQLDKERMIMLAEGQRPILCSKVRYHKLKALSDAANFSESHVPEVASVDLLPYLPVPATKTNYSASSDAVSAIPTTAEPLQIFSAHVDTARVNDPFESQSGAPADVAVYFSAANQVDTESHTSAINPIIRTHRNSTNLAEGRTQSRKLSKTAQKAKFTETENGELFGISPDKPS